MTKKKPKSEWKDFGRPTVFTEEVLRKLEEAFMRAYTDVEACLYAGIGARSLYDYCKANPDFAQRKEDLKNTPNMYAKNNMLKSIQRGNVETSKWWLERRNPAEFKLRKEIAGVGDAPLIVEIHDSTALTKEVPVYDDDDE